MKTNYLYLGALLITLLSCKDNVKVEVSKDKTDTVATEMPEAPKPDSATVAKAWEAYMTPSKAHEMLTKDTGIWHSELTFWSPDSPEPMKSTATATYKMILGGKYQEGTFSGDMMGMPFEGKGIVAYDNAKEEFISTWIDNMGTGMFISRGKYDETSKTLTLLGTMVDPVTKKEKQVKEIVTYIDNDNQKMEMFDVENGKEFKSMEIVSKRKK